MQDFGRAGFWTLSSMLNRWYVMMHNGKFLWRHLARDHWAKVHAIRELLEGYGSGQCDWVAWIDSDAYFATSESVEAIAASLGDVDLVLPRQPRPEENATAHFMLFRSNEVIRHFFKLVWDLPYIQPETAGRFLKERFHDQSVINLVLRQQVTANIEGLRVGYVQMEDFGTLNSRVVVHQGGLKYEGFRQRLLAELLARARGCLECRQDPVWRRLNWLMGNQSVEEAMRSALPPPPEFVF